MSNEQFIALMLMSFVGFFPAMVLIVHYEDLSRFVRVALSLWAAFWLTPPLMLVWIRGVFG